MKIIDEKGRLFGKLNLIDLLVIVLVIAAVGAVAMKVFGNKTVENAVSPTIGITYEVVCEDVPQHVADYCTDHVGEQMLSSGKLLDAHITDCKTETQPDGTLDLYFTIEGSTKFSGHTYVMGSQEVRVGMEHIVKTSSIECEGIISSLEADHE